jgi:hypothetical protein
VKIGTENIIARTSKITLLVVKSESFFPTLDSSGIGSSSFLSVYRLSDYSGTTYYGLLLLLSNFPFTIFYKNWFSESEIA